MTKECDEWGESIREALFWSPPFPSWWRGQSGERDSICVSSCFFLAVLNGILDIWQKWGCDILGETENRCISFGCCPPPSPPGGVARAETETPGGVARAETESAEAAIAARASTRGATSAGGAPVAAALPACARFSVVVLAPAVCVEAAASYRERKREKGEREKREGKTQLTHVLSAFVALPDAI